MSKWRLGQCDFDLLDAFKVRKSFGVLLLKKFYAIDRGMRRYLGRIGLDSHSRHALPIVSKPIGKLGWQIVLVMVRAVAEGR